MCMTFSLILDVGVYGPVKASWRNIPRRHKNETHAAEISKENFQGNSLCPFYFTLSGVIFKLW